MPPQYKYYEFYLYPTETNFQDSKYIEFLTTRKLWRYGFSISGSFWCGLEYKGSVSLINGRNAIKFSTESKRTYAHDILIRFEVLTKCLEILTGYKENLTLYSSDNILYEETRLPVETEFPLKDKSLKDEIYPLRFHDITVTTLLGFCLEELYNLKKDGTLETCFLLDDVKFPQFLHYYGFLKILDKEIGLDIRTLLVKLKTSLPKPNNSPAPPVNNRNIEIQNPLYKTKVI